jgi:Mg2+ transporter MgtE
METETQGVNQQTFDGFHDDALAKVLQTVRETASETTPLLSFVADYDDAVLANLMESLSDAIRVSVWSSIPIPRWWPVLHLLQYETAHHVFSWLSLEQQQRLREQMDERDLVTFADLLPEAMVDEYLDQQEKAVTEQLQQALAYQDDEVGRYINYNVLKIRNYNSIQRVKDRIKNNLDDPYIAIYVLDREGQFCGSLSFKTIISADPKTKVGSLAQAIEVLQDEQNMTTVAQTLNPVDGLAWHPVQSNGHIVGAISLARLTLALKEKSLEILGTERRTNEEDLFTPILSAAQLRAVWLITNLLTAFLASAVIKIFEGTLQQVVALAILMPVVASMGGIAGSQTLAIALRGIALNYLQRSNLRLLFDKELKIALLNGLVLGCIIGMVVIYWFDSIPIGVIIFIAIFVNSLAAAASATYIPFALKRMNIDPAIAGSVILTTVTDIVGFVVFLGLGSLFLM